MEPNYTFGDKLNSLRLERNLTVHELAKLSGVSQPLISNLIHGQRVIGEYTARKIARALQLRGEELEEFIHLAINNCSQRVLSSFRTYPSEVLNMVAGELNALGILPSQIARCVRRPDDGADAALYLNNGMSAFINIEVAIR